jgi:hypothetical protein
MTKLLESRLGLTELLHEKSVGIELGVATGKFSKFLSESGKFSEFWGIDKWDDHHDIQEYHNCVKTLGHVNILRATFNECLILFPNNYFDFIYIDGYAHTGQDGGSTLYEWFPKLKVGGVFSGHDYDREHWKKTYDSVNDFTVCCDLHRHLNVIQNEEEFNSWWLIKPNE